MLSEAAPLRLHDTRSPITCCPRCRKAELLGRARKKPVFRYDRVDPDDAPARYDVFHGDDLVAVVDRRRSSENPYRIVMTGEPPSELAAGSLRDARVVAEEAYTAVWREGRPAARGPALDL